MERYFFHFKSPDSCIRDTNGRELSDLASAHRHAMLLIHKIILLDPVDWCGWSINVTVKNNRSVLSVLFPQIPACSLVDRQGRGSPEPLISV
jgi:Domain of unknown function (DUF6894)